MDYNNPRVSGKKAFLRGVVRGDNPASRRTEANAHLLWDRGWVEQSEINCPGIEVATNVYSGCIQEHGDCPVCGL